MSNTNNVVKVLNSENILERIEISSFGANELAQKLGDEIRVYQNVELDLDGKKANLTSADKQAILSYFVGENGITYSVGIILLDGEYSMFTLDMQTGERIVGGNAKLLDLHYRNNELRSILEHLIGHNKKLDMTSNIPKIYGYDAMVFESKGVNIQSKYYAKKIRETEHGELFHILTNNGKGLAIRDKSDGKTSFQLP